MKKSIIVILLFSFSLALGQQVSFSNAQKAVNNYLKNYGYSDVGIKDYISYDRNNSPYIYVFNTEGDIEVYTLNGRSVITSRVDGISTTLDISSLPTGTYIVRITTNNGTAYKKLVVK